MLKTKWKFVAVFSLFIVIMNGNFTYAAENFFWSDIEPVPSCYTSRDGESNEMGMVVDGKKVSLNLPSCEEAKKTHVIVLVKGKYLQIIAGTGAEPYIEKGRTMIPLRALADGFGFEAVWEQSDDKITLKKENTSIIMHIGQSEMLVDGKKVNLKEAVPVIKNNVTFLPVRQLAEILGVEAVWDGKTRTATFTDKEE
ncbi:copper amine oxidase N-terminal domain-containing protein [Paenibacillus nasutitermitis]|uniref:Copper amine oxidase-like N-terminal domain-containing protein n=1 Tax=Paenibacillus nasutitermitis TaxID=1652958 RepID=A0A917E1V9_9BACL|nr:copper amine oxidase N-terminal domain-containing protein [Paenibacillus nasutitermitis]GGD94014.1 hypothetical protein GCM10010911_60890 [Paenibacillus nasutitermitis]